MQIDRRNAGTGLGLMIAMGLALAVSANAQPVPCYTVNHQQTPAPFNKIFDLWCSPTMVDSLDGGWNQEDIDRFANALINDDPDDDQDIFPRIWNYFCHGDSAAAHDSVRFVVGGKTFTKIRTDVYFQADCCLNTCGEEGCPNTWSSDCKRGGWIECNGFGVYRGENRFAIAGGLCPAERPLSPKEVAAPVWSHELSHLCDKANKRFVDTANSELLATAAEYLAGDRWTRRPDIPRSTEYDVSLMTQNRNNLRCAGSEVRCKYNQYRLWNGYLFEHFSGSADSLDIVYRWIRYQEDGEYITSFRGLGHVLMESPFANRVDGETPAEKMGALYQRFAIARYVDEPSAFEGRYGFGPEVSPRHMRFFEWPDTVAISRARAVPPVIRVGDRPDTLSEWRDPVQPWAEPEPCRVLTTGTDYLLFLADLSITGERMLSIRIRGQEPIPENQSFRIGPVTYDRLDSVLYDHVPVSVVENVGVPHVYPAETLDVEFTVAEFGAGAQAVLVVFSMVQETLTKEFRGVENMDYEVIYSLAAPR
jgi:hypothetical protein